MFITLFTFWSGADYACMAVAVLLAYGVLSVGSKLFLKKVWPWQQPSMALRMLLPALVMVSPLLFYLHTLKAEALADGERGRALLAIHYINQDSNTKLLSFFEEYSRKCREEEEFMQTAVPAYAERVWNAHSEMFLPVKSWPNVEALPRESEARTVLSDVWGYRGSAELHRDRRHVYSVLNTAVRDYLVAEQQKQNLKELQDGYSVHLWFLFTVIFSFYLASTWVPQEDDSNSGDTKLIRNE